MDDLIVCADVAQTRSAHTPPNERARRVPNLAVIALVALVALGVRLTYILAVTQHRDLGFDSAYYDLVARELREGHGFLDPFAFYFGNRFVPTALFPPGYPFALAILGLPWRPTHLTHLVLSGVLGTITVVLIAILTTRLLGHRAGVVAGLVAAFHPMLFGADGALMAESLYGALVVTSLILTYLVLERRRMLTVVALALVVGVAALVRGEGLLLLALPLLASLRAPRGRALGQLGLSVTIVAALQLPWAVRNHNVFGTVVVGSNNSSTVIGGANCKPAYYGDKLGYWDFNCLKAERPGWMEMSETQLNNQIRLEGLQYAHHHLQRAPIVAMARLARTWGLYHPLGQMRLESLEGRVYPYQLAGWILSLITVPLAAIGLIRLRRRGIPIWPLVATVLIVSFTSIVTYGNQRFRLAAEPALVIGAVASPSHRCRRRSIRSLPTRSLAGARGWWAGKERRIQRV